MDEILIAILIALLSCLGGVICGYLAFFRLNHTQQRVEQLEWQLAQLQRELKQAKSLTEPARHLEQVDKSEQTEIPAQALGRREPSPVIATVPSTTTPQKPRMIAPARSERVMKYLTANWMVVCGGVSLALAGLFLVRYSIEAGLFSPALRVALATLFATGLIGLGSYLKNQHDQSQVHAACAGAGSVILYGCVLASGALYGWLTNWGMFGGLAVISVLSMGLGLRHGPYLAGLGILGAFAVPIFVSTGQHNIAGVLGYSLIVASGGFALLRYVYRDWLWWGIWGLALMWLGVSLARPEQAQGLRPLYLLALLYLGFALPLLGWRWQCLTDTGKTLLRQASGQYQLIGLWLLLALCQWAIIEYEYATWLQYLSAAGLFGLALWFFGSNALRSYRLFWLVGLMGLLPMVLELLTQHGNWGQLSAELEHSYGLMAVLVSGLALVLAGGNGWQRASVSHMALASFTPLLMILMVDLRLAGVIGGYVPIWVPLLWLAATIVALWCWRQQTQPESKVTVVLLLALQAALSISLVSAFAELRLTLALAMQWLSLVMLSPYLAIAPIAARFKFAERVQTYTVEPLALLARVMLVIVLVRLALNPYLPAYQATGAAYLTTYLGCFICGLLCVLWLHRFQPESHLRLSFEVGSVQLFALAVAALTRYHLYDGQLFVAQLSWVESGIYANTLLVAAWVYQYRAQYSSSRWSRRCYYGLSLLQGALALGFYFNSALLQNPNWLLQPLSSTPLLNELLLIYGGPALILGLIAWQQHHAFERSSQASGSQANLVLAKSWRDGLAFGAGAMAILFVLLQIRHLWHGGIWPGLPMPNGEQYSYSVFGLLLGGGLMLAALRKRSSKLHQLATVILLIVVGKIFIADLAGLDGLWRVASFLGLGVTLLGLAYGYNRLNQALISQSKPQHREEI